MQEKVLYLQAAAVCGAGFCLSVEPDEWLHGGMYRECTVAPAGGAVAVLQGRDR